jgi:mRNA-degrading endonuclease toxin of MazEF toxin-antitoxin module
LADWQSGARPKEPNKLRPAVVEEDGLFAPVYPNVILVPLTEDGTLVIPDLSVAIEPTAGNGCATRCWAAAHLVTTTSKYRVRPTESSVTAEQLTRVRRAIAMAPGLQG